MTRGTTVKALMLFGATATIALAGFDARANPTLNAQLRALQLPDTFHVQVTLARIVNPPGIVGMYGQWLTFDPVAIRRDGHELVMHGPTTIEANSGSGLSTGPGWQACDCNLAPGEYAYDFVPPEGKGVGMDDWERYVAVTVIDPPPPPAEPAGTVDVDYGLYSMNEPEFWPQGIDCVAWCAENPDPPGNGAENRAETHAPDVGSAPNAQGSKQPSGDSSFGGCRMGDSPTRTTLLPLLLLSLLLWPRLGWSK